MAEKTGISWADSTFNPWWGCTKVSSGCDNCYAEALSTRFGGDVWGHGKPRKRTSDANWRKPLKWNRSGNRVCDGCGKRFDGSINTFCPDWVSFPQMTHRRRVFCGSMCDIFDNEVPIEWLRDLLELIRFTPNLDWLLLTKRPAVVWGRLFNLAGQLCLDRTTCDLGVWIVDWLDGKPPANVWLGTSCEDQATADARIPALLMVPARVRFLSCEPLIGPINLPYCTFCGSWNKPHICEAAGDDEAAFDWVIVGGESGADARPVHPDWVVSLRDQCAEAGVPFFFKQWGEWAPRGTDAREEWVMPDGSFAYDSDDPAGGLGIARAGGRPMHRVGKCAAGHLLDGVEHHEFPGEVGCHA